MGLTKIIITHYGKRYYSRTSQDRKLYLAISAQTYHDLFRLEAVQLLMKHFAIPLIVVDVEQQEVVEWIE